jgi:hypothetical protein
MHLATAAKATAEQLVTVTTGEGLGSKDNWHADAMLQHYAPGTVKAFARSWQQHDRFDFAAVNLLHVPVALIASLMLPVIIVTFRRRNLQLSLLAATALFALFINAAVCGIFSNPNARYQSLIIPAAVLVALLAVLDLWTANRRRDSPAALSGVSPARPDGCRR